MKSLPCLLSAVAFGSAPLLSADPAPQPPVSFTEGSSGTWNVDWAGVSSRTYFLQGSQDLVSWDYAPMVEFGTGVKSFGMDTGNADKYFVRLQYTDDPGVTSLEEAHEADFDLDGMPNYWEISHGLNPTNAMGNDGATGDLDGDGYSNIQEYYFESAPDDPASHPVGKIASAYLHSMALATDGQVWSWGYNSYGQLGDGTTQARDKPVPLATVPGMSRIIGIATGEGFSLALDDKGSLWGWGSNASDQISKDPVDRYLSTVRIELPTQVVSFACGPSHVVAVDREGKLWAWGDNSSGQLGQGHASPVTGFMEIVRPAGMQRVVSVAATGNSNYAVDAGGKIWSWGYNGGGVLGDGTSTNRHSPVAVDVSNGVPAIRSVHSGTSHVLALGVDGSIWSWGSNSYGQLGRGNYTPSNKPVAVTSGISQARTLGLGFRHSLAASPSGVVWSWGDNGNGQLGIGSTSGSNAPAQTSVVTDWSDIVALAGGYYHSLGVKADGSVWSWGRNSSFQLGLGDSTQRLVPTLITNLKLSDDDSDSDGLPDSFERFYFAGSLAYDGSHVAVAGGASLADAYAYRLNPLVADNDDDGISDAVEIAAGLDPVDWSDATGDLDGDRIPNLWEQAMGSDMTDDGSTPDDATQIVLTVSTGQSIQSAINSVPANSGNPTWAIIKVEPGIYNEGVQLTYNKRILLLSTGIGGIPEIRSPNTSPALEIRSEGVVDGFRITHSKDVAGWGVYSVPTTGRKLVRIVNCLIHGHSGLNGNGIYQNNDRLVVAHCSVFGNSSENQADGMYVSSSAKALLINSIFQNPDGKSSREIYARGITEIRQTVISDDSVSGGLPIDPLLNPVGLITKASPARSTGSTRALGFRDIHDEERGLLPDIGADQFVDTDDDGLPDWLELLGVTDPTGDDDNDGVLNLAEYETTGSDPLDADVDGDGLNDGGELAAGSNPFDPDSDTDGMDDKWEVDYGLNPISDQDALEDPDGDRIPNLYEYHNGTIPNVAAPFTPHITVDPAAVTTTASLKTTIKAAISEPSNNNRYTVIRVKPGVYGDYLTIDSKRILLLADLGPVPVVIAPTSSSQDALTIRENSAVLDGFTIMRGNPLNADQGLYVYTDLEREQVRLVNCTISGFSSHSGAAGYLGRGRLTLVHCTVMDNTAISTGRAFDVFRGNLSLLNTIIWNPSGTAPEQISKHSQATVTATASIVLGGEFGGISSAPLTDRYYGLLPGSPAIGAGTPLYNDPFLDRHGDPRPLVTPDIGADQYLDSDTDTLPDWWEKFHFGNLTKADTSDDDTPSPDGLENRYENLLGFDPTNPDTLGNGSGDLFNAIFTSRADPWYPAEWQLDTDGDGLTNGQEIYYGTSSTDADTNGDGVPDKIAIQSGISATSLDTDGDGVSNAQEIIDGTNPFLADTDGDGVADNLDAFPLDPSRWDAPTGAPGDVTAPQIVLITPENATPL